MTTPHAFVPNPLRPRLLRCYACTQFEWEPIHIQTLPGMAEVAELRAAALAETTGKAITAELRTPLASIDARTGEMERRSPLFQGSEANPERQLFE